MKKTQRVRVQELAASFIAGLVTLATIFTVARRISRSVPQPMTTFDESGLMDGSQHMRSVDVAPAEVHTVGME